ncbi:hypothetical protein [Marmoricola sp. OAE513]|uniref:hypothetical protein n=1 Tax=Marmoricola sp. OAE513 TaxID=2817894 RepID=UPI001AE4805F
MNASTHAGDLDDPAELQRFLTSYRPSAASESTWVLIAPAVVDLVTRAGPLTRLRVEKDIQCVGHVVAHLISTGRPVTLEEVLDDRTLLSYDLVLQRRSPGGRTRENQRGILRRLQAVHRDLPWRQPRRADGARVAAMIQPATLDALRHTEASALRHASDPTSTLHQEAAAFLTVLAQARTEQDITAATTAAGGDTTTQANARWRAARSFAASRSMNLTKPVLAAAITYEVLEQDEPVAVLISNHGLTRRDLDLALTRAQGLPLHPEPENCRILRGTLPAEARDSRSS